MQEQNKVRAIVSIGIRCFAENYLKQLGLCQFSSPLGSTSAQTIENTIKVIENDFFQLLDHSNWRFSKDYQCFAALNERHGCRTNLKSFDFFNLATPATVDKSFHLSFVPHHDMSTENHKNHFKRAVERLVYLNRENVPTLYCFFVHENYGTDKMPTEAQLLRLGALLRKKNDHSHLLVVLFHKSNTKILDRHDDVVTIVNRNNNSVDFEQHKQFLRDYFEHYLLHKEQLLTYAELDALLQKKNKVNEAICQE